MNEKIKFNIEDTDFSPYMLDSIVALMVLDVDFLSRCYFTFKHTVFEDERREIIKLCYKYYKNHKEAPKDYIYDLVSDYVSKQKTKKKILMKYLNELTSIKPNKKYVLDIFGNYVKTTIQNKAIEEAQKLLDSRKDKEAHNHILEKFADAYRVNAANVIDFLSEEQKIVSSAFTNLCIRLGIKQYDDAVGGLYRKEFLLFVADSSVGKSWFMVHCGKMGLTQGKKVLHITLEDPEEQVKQRYSQAFTSSIILNENIKIKKKKIKVNNKEIKIKKLRIDKLNRKKAYLKRIGAKLWIHDGTTDAMTVSDIEAIINNIELHEGVTPDLILLDTPDYLAYETKYNNEIANIKALYKSILRLCRRRNVGLIATTQLNKIGAQKINPTGRDAAESSDKRRIVDSLLVAAQTDEELKKGKIRIFHDKSRGNAKSVGVIEIYQALSIGQFCLDSKIVRNDISRGIIGGKEFNKDEKTTKRKRNTVFN